MRSFSLSFSVSSSLSSRWRGSSSKKKKTLKKKKTNRCRQTSRNFTVASLKNDENDDDDQTTTTTTTTTTTPVGMVMVKEEAKEKTIESSKVDFAMPTRLLSSENLTTDEIEDARFRTYTLHIRSGFPDKKKESSFDWEQPSALNVCIIGTDGRALMERIDSFTADGREGRFNVPGKTDIVTFRAREVGKPTALWVSVEGKHVKSWTLDCISIVDTFDERPEENAINFPTKYYECDVVKAGALELRPGEVKKKSPEQIEMEREVSMHNYDAYKMRLFCFTAGIIAAGFTLEFTKGDIEQAKAFASGGVIGVLYMQMLTKSIDQFFSGVDDEEEKRKKSEREGEEGVKKKFSLESPFARLQKIADIVIGSTPVRMSVVAYFGYLAAQHFGADHCLGWTIFGFFSYKFAVFPATFSHFGDEEIDLESFEAMNAIPISSENAEGKFGPR
ncbi:unnamed protein product [Bathycoccus prasinos]